MSDFKQKMKEYPKSITYLFNKAMNFPISNKMSVNIQKLQTIGPGIVLNSKTIASWRALKMRQRTSEDGANPSLTCVFNHKYLNSCLNFPIKNHLVRKNRIFCRKTQDRVAAITIYQLNNTKKEIGQISPTSVKWRRSRRVSMEASPKYNLKTLLCSTKINQKAKVKC